MRPSSSCCIVWAALLLLGACSAQTSVPTPDCNSALVSLLPCLDYVQANVSSPSQNCCVGVKAVVQNTPSCLCTLFNNASSLPITVNQARASALPGACNVTAPAPTLCGGVLAPAVAPVVAPATPPPSPAAAVTPTPVVAPSTPPTTPPTPAPAVTPAVAPTAPSLTPTPVTAPVPAPTTVPAPAPVTTSPVPAIAPSTVAPTPPVASSPPAPPPAQNPNHGAAVTASILLSALTVMLSSVLFV